jgi:hypothetical protein
MKTCKPDVIGAVPVDAVGFGKTWTLSEAPMTLLPPAERRPQFDRKNFPCTVSGVTASAAL